MEGFQGVMSSWFAFQKDPMTAELNKNQRKRDSSVVGIPMTKDRHLIQECGNRDRQEQQRTDLAVEKEEDLTGFAH